MNDLVLKYLSADFKVPEKIKLRSELVSKRKIVVLDRQIIKYLTKPESYKDPKTIEFINQIKKEYDKSSNVITVLAAFYEGGSGYFENESEKRHKALLDLKGIERSFKQAKVDEQFLFKKMKEATFAFTQDSELKKMNKKFSTIIRKTFDYYWQVVDGNFNGDNIIESAKCLKNDMSEYCISIGEPISQYCFALLTDNKNAKKIFKIKGMRGKDEGEIQKKIYNAYSDLRMIQFLNHIRAHIFRYDKEVEVCFLTNDKPLEQFFNELESSVNRYFSDTDKFNRMTNYYSAEINFEIFNIQHFKNNEFDRFKDLFFNR